MYRLKATEKYLAHDRSHKYIKRLGSPGNYTYVYEDDIVKDDIVKDDIVKDDIVKDDIVKDDIVKDDIVKDDIIKDDIIKDETKEEQQARLTKELKEKTRYSIKDAISDYKKLKEVMNTPEMKAATKLAKNALKQYGPKLAKVAINELKSETKERVDKFFGDKKKQFDSIKEKARRAIGLQSKEEKAIRKTANELGSIGKPKGLSQDGQEKRKSSESVRDLSNRFYKLKYHGRR